MKQVLGIVTEEITVGGETVENVLGDVVRAAPKTILVNGERVENTDDSELFVRLQLFGRGTWLWSGDPAAFDFATDNLDPDIGSDWTVETAET